MNGPTSGAITNFLLKKHIRLWLAINHHLHTSHGSGILHVKPSTIFFWLLLLDRLNTRNLLGRKRFELPSYSCVTINCPEEETLVHLFLSCPFVEACWDYICPQRTRNLAVWEALSDIREKIQQPFAMDIIILAAWSIWIVRNNKLFRNERPRFASWKAIYFQELRLMNFRMKKKHAESFREWLQSQI